MRSEHVRLVAWLARAQLGTMPERPIGRASWLLAVACGCLAAIVPGGLQGLDHGLGIWGGARQGLQAWWIAGPLLLAVLVLGSVAVPAPPSVAQAQELAGQSRFDRQVAGWLAAIAWWLVSGLGAVVAGMVSGAGDSLRQGSGWVAAPSGGWGLAWGSVESLVAVVASALLVAAIPSRSWSVGVAGLVLALELAGLLALTSTGSPLIRQLVVSGPLGPWLVHTVDAQPGVPWALDAGATCQWVATICWLGVLCLAVVLRHRWRGAAALEARHRSRDFR